MPLAVFGPNGNNFPMKLASPFFCGLLAVWGTICAGASGPDQLSPTALVATDKTCFIACGMANRVLCLDLTRNAASGGTAYKVAGGQNSTIFLPLPPSGLALSRDGAKVVVGRF